MNDQSGIKTVLLPLSRPGRRLPVRHVRLPCGERARQPDFRPALLLGVADVGVDTMRLDREATATAEVIGAIRAGRTETRAAGRATAG